MSIQGQREAIVSALAAVPGVSATYSAPDVQMAGAAWPAWRDASWIAFGKVVGVWYVYVGLQAANSQATADDADGLMDLVAAALWRVGQVTLVEPWQWQLESGGQTLPALRFTLEV